MNVNDMMPLRAAREEFLRVAMDEGARCPCCDRYAQKYTRTLNSRMAKALVLLARYFKENPAAESVFAPDYLEEHGGIRGHQSALLCHWGLIEPMPRPVGSTRRGSKGFTGYYRVTQKGHDFAAGRVTVPRAYYEFQGEPLGFVEEHTTIDEALTAHFDIDEAMHPANEPMCSEQAAS